MHPSAGFERPLESHSRGHLGRDYGLLVFDRIVEVALIEWVGQVAHNFGEGLLGCSRVRRHARVIDRAILAHTIRLH